MRRLSLECWVRDVADDPRGPEQEVDDEIAWHLERVADALRAQGYEDAAARAEARRRFGDVGRYRRRMIRFERGRRRMQTMERWVDGARRHLGFAVRSLVRSPGFTTAVVMTLGLGIGANATMFGILDRLFLATPAHVVDGAQVRTVYVRRAFLDRVNTGATLTLPDLDDLRSVAGIQAAAAWTKPSQETVTTPGGGTGRARVATAEPALFPLLGTPVRAGRTLVANDDVSGATPVALVSPGFAEGRLGGEDEVLGRTLRVAGTSFTVVGVVPPDFTGPGLQPVDVWLPLRVAAEAAGNGQCVESRGCWWVRGVVRLSAGEGAVERSTDAATAAHRAARADIPSYDPEAEIVLGPLQEARGPSASDESRVAAWLSGVALLVLLIACANVANLLLVRATRRRHELAVRSALGVGRGGLLAGLLVEAALLAGMGTAAALLVARAGGSLLRAVLIPEVYFPPAPPGRLLVFALLAAGVTLTLAALYPAAVASRTTPARVLRGAGSGARAGRVRRLLLVGQVALSAILLVGAALFLESFERAASLDLGWDRDAVLVASLEFEGERSPEERRRVYAHALERLRSNPAVAAASPTIAIPFWSSFAVPFEVEGRDSLPPLPTGGPYVNAVDAQYFETMGLQLERGRSFPQVALGATAPYEVVVNHTMAETYWPGADPLGRCVRIMGDDKPCTTVVGVVADHRRVGLEEEATGLYYLPMGHPALSSRPPQSLMVRTVGAPSDAAGSLQGVLADLDPAIRFARVEPLSDLVDPHLRSWRLGAVMLSIFGVLALVVAAVGLYGVLAFEVALRRRELGVRAALGAAMGDLVAMVLRDAVVLTASGVLVGGVLAAVAARKGAPLLFHVSPWQPRAYVVMALTMLATAVVAGSIPAWRSARVDPSQALRQD